MQTKQDRDKDADAEDLVKVKRGRPKGKGRSHLEILKEDVISPVTSKRRISSPTTTSCTVRQDGRAAGTIPRQRDSNSTTSRPSYYIVGKAPISLNMSKLPKSGPVLGLLLSLLEGHSLSAASKMVGEQVKIVWKHHFGPRFIMGKEFGKEMEAVTNEKLKIIKSDRHVAEKVVALYKQ